MLIEKGFRQFVCVLTPTPHAVKRTSSLVKNGAYKKQFTERANQFHSAMLAGFKENPHWLSTGPGNFALTQRSVRLRPFSPWMSEKGAPHPKNDVA
jgi:hypothetical protein